MKVKGIGIRGVSINHVGVRGVGVVSGKMDYTPSPPEATIIPFDEWDFRNGNNSDAGKEQIQGVNGNVLNLENFAFTNDSGWQADGLHFDGIDDSVAIDLWHLFGENAPFSVIASFTYTGGAYPLYLSNISYDTTNSTYVAPIAEGRISISGYSMDISGVNVAYNDNSTLHSYSFDPITGRYLSLNGIKIDHFSAEGFTRCIFHKLTLYDRLLTQEELESEINKRYLK